MAKNVLVETVSNHSVKFKISKKGVIDENLREILINGLKQQGVSIPSGATFSMSEESGWDDSDYVLRIAWET